MDKLISILANAFRKMKSLGALRRLSRVGATKCAHGVVDLARGWHLAPLLQFCWGVACGHSPGLSSAAYGNTLFAVILLAETFNSLLCSGD